jgi:ribose-phosphate pyrophosphokinase
MVFYGDPDNTTLSEEVAKGLGVELYYPEIDVFADGEKRVRLAEHVVGKNVVILKSLFTPVDDNVIKLAFTVDAAKRSGGEQVVALVPYLGYSRGDHVFRSGEAVSLEVVIKILQINGVDKISFVDPHSIKIPEMFEIPATDLSALPLFATKIRQIEPDLSKITLVTPDMGGIRRIKILSELLDNANYACINKDRDKKTGDITMSGTEGDFRGTCFVVDDMIATGGTIVQAADFLQKVGINDVYLVATHPLLYGKAVPLLKESKVKGVIVMDTVDVPSEKQFDHLEIISCAPLLIDYIQTLENFS